jgi:hypothetical protein
METKDVYEDSPATEAAKQWDGWGTALKPSVEFFTLCRKPLSEKTVAANVLKWGTGGINIDGCRVGKAIKPTQSGMQRFREYSDKNTGQSRPKMQATTPKEQGRFPANLIHDGSQEVLDLFPETKSAVRKPKQSGKAQDGWGLGARKLHKSKDMMTKAPQLASSTALKLPRRIATRGVRS